MPMAYERIRERGHRVAAVSAALLERVAPTGESLVVPNGLEPTEWLKPATQQPADPEQTGARLRGHLGRTPGRGVAARDRASHAAGARSRWWGRSPRAAHFEPLKDEPNVAIHPPLERAGLAELIRTADVGLIPHRRTALTEAMSPLKLYEYLAGGLPVAATDLAPMRGIDARVHAGRRGWRLRGGGSAKRWRSAGPRRTSVKRSCEPTRGAAATTALLALSLA